MPLNNLVFEPVKPSVEQQASIGICQDAAGDYAATLEKHVPEGPDKTFLLRKLREVAMWANVAITRQPDGSPRV